MDFNYEQERTLEFKYQGVLDYPEAKVFLSKTPYTSGKINGAIVRSGIDKPKNFIEMELFVNDLVDFWLDTNPEDHTDGEAVLRRAVSNYVAFAIVWKAKAKASSIFDPVLMRTCGKAIQIKNALGQAIKIINSYAKRNAAIDRNEIAEGFVLGFSTVMSLANGKNPVPEIPEDLTRLVGAYLAGNKSVKQIASELTNQIDYDAVQTLNEPEQPRKT